jgi:hypothetical protein
MERFLLKNKIPTIISELEAYSKTLDEGCISYWYYHKKRYLWFIEALADLIDNNALQKDLRILDIAPLYQTLLMSKLLSEATVDTMGYVNGPFHPQTNSKHIQYDLNDCYYKDRYLSLTEDEKYDIVVMLEVIEHLPTSLPQVFDFLRSLVKENGILIIQTPNAVSLSKRFIIARGENPYERIRENMREDPSHYREYTRNELSHFGYQAGFDVLDTFMVNYFCEEANLYGRLDKISRYLPENFITGMAII